jgi:hypothetical protein
MTSRSTLPYHVRAAEHENRLVKELFRIAETKKTNLVLSADLTTSEELLRVADGMFEFACACFVCCVRVLCLWYWILLETKKNAVL